MKRIVFLSIIFICSFAVKAQQLNHPTVLKVEVNYTEDPINGFVVDSVRKVRLNAHITLKDSAAVSKIHLTIKTNSGDTVLYQVVYTIGTEAAINDAGVTLFKKEEDGIIHISSSSLFPLMAYRYEISTEDSSAAESDSYSSIQ